MKKLPLIINVILIVAVAILYVLHFTSSQDSEQAETNNSSIVPVEGIVYINIDSVLKNYKMYDDIAAELQTNLKTKDAELQSKQRKFEKAVSDYQNKAAKGLITRSEAAAMEQNLQAEQQNLLQLQQKMQYDLAEEEQVSQRKMLNSIMEYLKSVENEKSYQFVLGTSFGGNILYANDGLNITKEVVSGLNKQYLENKE